MVELRRRNHYNSLFGVCAEKQNVDEGPRLLGEVRAVRIAPSYYTLSIRVKLVDYTRRLYQAFQLGKNLYNQNVFEFRPNVSVYTYLTQACENRRFGCALQLHGRVETGTKCAIVKVLLNACPRRYTVASTAVDVVLARKLKISGQKCKMHCLIWQLTELTS